MTDQNCIFCKILAGDIPSAVVYEDDDFKVILDVGPAAKGHMLILPKEHYADIMASGGTGGKGICSGKEDGNEDGVCAGL